MNPQDLKRLELPIDLDNEALILSNAIKEPSNRSLFTKYVDYLDFRYKENQVIAWSIKELDSLQLEVNLDAILLKSKSCPVGYKVDFEFLDKLIQNYPSVPASNYEAHLEKLRLDKLKQTLASSFFSTLYPACLDPSANLEVLSGRLQAINEILEKGYSYSQSQFKTMKEIVEEFRAYKNADSGLYTTGFRQLDDKLSEGFKKGGVTIICGLPGMGKSSWTLSSMYNLNNLGVFCPQFALEMDAMAITTKLAAFASRIPVTRITKDFKNLTVDEKKLLEYELDRLASSKYLYFNDTPGQTLASIREQILILQDKLHTDYMFVSIDLFGKISDFQSSDNFASDYEKKLNQVQVMAKELQVNFGLVAQIRRSVNERRFNRPKMSDIKNAGAWEEVADLILAIHRPFYDPEVALKKELARNAASGFEDSDVEVEHDPNENLAELIILKQRMGLANTLVNFYFDNETTRYSPISAEDQEILNQQKIDEFDE